MEIIQAPNGQELVPIHINDWNNNYLPECPLTEFCSPKMTSTSALYMKSEFMDKVINWRRNIYKRPIAFHGPQNGAFSSDGHAGNSAHYTGEAIDFHVPGLPAPIAENVGGKNMLMLSFDHMQTLMSLVEAGFSGIGVYPFWKPTLGFHVDIATRHSIWWRDLGGKYHYFIGGVA